MPDDAHYEYRFEDHSILLRLLERPVFAPLVRVIPRGITPNQITVSGQIAAAAAFALAVLGRPLAAPGLLLLAALALFYTVADAVDGAFARHSKQTSRLGELLDHWLDALSVPLLVLGFGLALPADPRLVFAATLVTSFLHYVTFLHGFRLGFVHLGAIGMVEGTFAGAAVCIIAAGTGPEPFARPLAAGLSGASWLLGALVVGGAFALWSMRGLARHGRDFLLPGAAFALVAAWFVFGDLPPALAGVLALAVGSRFEGQVIRARLLRESLPGADRLLMFLLVAGVGLSVGLSLSARAQAGLAGIAVACALLRQGRAFARTVAALLAPAPAPR